MTSQPASVAGPREPQQTRSREARRRILRAAEEVLAADGFDDFTMAAVAERSGVSIGGIYQRFDSKVQLVAAVKDRGLRAVHEVERLFPQAAAPHLAEVRRADPEAALGVAGRVITGTCLQSCARGDMPGRAAWARLADELSAMAVAYLLTADSP